MERDGPTVKRFLFVFGFLCWAVSARAQVVFDANATASCTSNAVSTKDCATLTVGAGTNRALVCQISWSGTNGGVSLFNWDQLGTPQALTAITNATATNTVVSQLWGLVNPTSGAKTLRVTWTTARDVVINCLAYTGVDQTGGVTTFPHGAGATGTGVTPSVTVSSATNNAIVATHASTTGNYTAVSSTQTFINNTPANMSTGGNRAAGQASLAMTGTTDTSGSWASAGTDVLAAAGGTVVPKLPLLGVGP